MFWPNVIGLTFELFDFFCFNPLSVGKFFFVNDGGVLETFSLKKNFITCNYRWMEIIIYFLSVWYLCIVGRIGLIYINFPLETVDCYKCGLIYFLFVIHLMEVWKYKWGGMSNKFCGHPWPQKIWYAATNRKSKHLPRQTSNDDADVYQDDDGQVTLI